MGLLDSIIQSGQATKRNIRSLLDDPSGHIRALLNRANENTQAHLNKLTGKPYNPVYDQAFQDAMNEVAFNAMTVYHGSPHKFDKFDMSKIGTGEGAQAYGHGLYMAEHPATAETYAAKLANGGNMPMPPVIRNGFYGKNGKWYVKDASGNYSVQELDGDFHSVAKEEFANAYKWAMDDYKSRSKAGNLYKVDIPDEAIPRMLDWDKPLSEQSKEVQKALIDSGFAESAFKKELGIDRILGLPDYTGKDLYQSLKVQGGKDSSSEILAKQGIPGIRYLDGGSRGAGTGTSNYVLFDDQLPRILERNGVPTGLQPWAPGEWPGLLGR